MRLARNGRGCARAAGQGGCALSMFARRQAMWPVFAVVIVAMAGACNLPLDPGLLLGDPTNGGTVAPGQYDQPCVSEGEPADDTLRRMYVALNNYRRASGVPELAYSKTLEAAANFQAKDLCVRNFFAHVNPDGEGPGDRALRFGYCNQYAGENIGAGNALTTPEAVQLGFENSAPHDTNMRNEPYRLVGMGHYYNPATGWHYWVQVMALPPS
jgi:uncharacterized protein YkwD